MEIFEHLLRIFFLIMTAVCLGGAVSLYLGTAGNLSRRIFAYVLFLWGFIYLLSIVAVYCHIYIYCLVIHNLAVACTFAFIGYKGLFHKRSVSEDSLRPATGETATGPAAPTAGERKPVSVAFAATIQTSDESFTSKMPGYIRTFRHWMDTERPYLNKDFKLTDVARILPLNRSYLSRLFNEGMGKNFSDIVREYRLSDAKLLLVSNQDIPVVRIAEMCGFASASSFSRTFVQTEGITPKQYREQTNIS